MDKVHGYYNTKVSEVLEALCCVKDKVVETVKFKKNNKFYLRDHSYITSALVGGRGGQKRPIFAYS